MTELKMLERVNKNYLLGIVSLLMVNDNEAYNCSRLEQLTTSLIYLIGVMPLLR